MRATAKGFEFANLQAGADFELAGGVGIGPFVSCSVGQYSGLAVDPNPIGQPEDIPDKAFHGWLVLGVHTAFGL